MWAWIYQQTDSVKWWELIRKYAYIKSNQKRQQCREKLQLSA